MSLLLEIKGLRASYGKNAVLHGIDLSLPEGSVCALLGANGAGKTTTLRAICGMVERSGSIKFAGEPIERLATADIARLGVAHVPDDRGTFKKQTVEENLELGAITRRDRKAVATDKDRVFSYFPVLEKRRQQQAGTLSGGEQQMLAIGRALMQRPKLMLLDEPSFGLAPLITQEVFSILGLLREKERVSILVVEQNASLALKLASHADLIENGRIVLSGTAEALSADEHVRRSYLGY